MSFFLNRYFSIQLLVLIVLFISSVFIPCEIFSKTNDTLYLNPIVTQLNESAPPRISMLKPPQLVAAKPPLGHFTNFDTEQGLALSNITCVYVDRQGKVWFGTHGGGVSFYDGKKFTSFTTKNGLIHNSVWAIIEDSKGNFWFGTFGGGVSKYDGTKFTNYTTENGLVNNTIWTIAEDDNGKIWFGTFGNGISIYDGESFATFENEDELPNDTVWKIYKDKSGHLWFGTDDGVCKYDGENITKLSVKDGLTHNIVRDILEDKNGNYWFATFGGGVCKYDGESFTNFTTKEGLPHNTLRAIAEDKFGNIWVGSHGGGAGKYDGKSFKSYNVRQGLSNNVIRGIATDNTGNVWFGTDGGGASRYNGSAFKIYTKEQGLIYNSVRCIAEDNKGGLWFGTNGGGMSYLDGKYYHNYTRDNGLISNTVYSFLTNKNGNVWIGTDQGAVYFDGNTFTTYTVDQGLGHNRVLGIYEDSKGNIWFGTSNGVSVFDDKKITTFRTEHGIVHNVVRSITEDKSGNMWFGTYGGGISIYDGNAFLSFSKEDGLAHNWIRKIHIDDNGYVWIGTYGGGINRYDGDSFIKFCTEDGLADDVIYDIVEDEDGKLWIGTNLGFSGLSFTDKEGNIITAGNINADNKELIKDFKPKWDIYNTTTGYPLKDLNSNAMHISTIGLPYGNYQNPGIIWGGCGDDKVVSFDPKAVYKQMDPVEVIIDNVKIKDEDISWYLLQHLKNKNNKFDSIAIAQQQIITYNKVLSNQKIDKIAEKYSDIKFDSITRFTGIPLNLVLPHKHNDITIEFVAIQTCRNHLVNYQYMLEGQDKSWRSVTKNNYITFNNLLEGEYRIKIRAQNPEGVWSKAITYSFKVLPPWYRTWWMYSIYVLSVILIVILIINLRERKLQKEKLQLAEEVKKRTYQLEQQKEEAERQKEIVEEKNEEILAQQKEILAQKEELSIKSKELEKINATLENRIKKELAESRRKDFMLIQQGRQAAMGEMIANIAHQWRQPLNAIGLIIQNMQEAYEYGEMDKEYLDAKVKQSMEIILYMSDTINDFRDFFKPEKIATTFNPKRVLEKSISFVEDTIKKANISIEYKPAKEDIIAFGFANEYAQVILNLISNAKDALIKRQIKNAKIKITLCELNNKSCLSISDNAGGIDEKIKDKIYEPYFSTKEKGEGTGLGLYMSKTIIEKIEGGTLHFENTDEGAKFTVIL